MDARTRSPTTSSRPPGRSTRSSVKPFPGLAGESRSGDANGQWFRVLAAGGTQPRAFGRPASRHDRAAAAGRQPAASRSSARRSTPTCRARPADAGPALHPRAPPQQRRGHTSTTGAAGARAKVRKRWTSMKPSLKRERPGDKFKVRDKDITRSRDDIKKLATAKRRWPRSKKHLEGLRRDHRADRHRAGVVGGYILDHQRLRFPFLEPKPYQLKAEFSTAQAVVAGPGPDRPRRGRADRRHRRRRAQGRPRGHQDGHRPGVQGPRPHGRDRAAAPKTGLKDMFIDLEPGGREAPVAKRGLHDPDPSTQPDVNPDEVLSVLDADTRDYLQLLVNGAGRGLEGRGGDLRDLLARFEPTHRDLARVNGAVADAPQAAAPPRQLAATCSPRSSPSRDDDLASSSTLRRRVFARSPRSRPTSRAAVGELPGTLQQTTDTLGRVETFAELLGPTTEKLRPAARALAPANEAVRPFAKEADAAAAQEHPPVRARGAPARARPAPGVRAARQGRPDLTQVFVRAQPLPQPARLQPERQGGPGQRGPPGGLPVLAGVAEPPATQLFSTSDAHGTFRPVTIAAPCATLAQVLAGAARARVHLGADRRC